MSHSPTMELKAECFIKPKYEIEESKHPYHLGPWDITMLSVHYIQKGLLFLKPSNPNFSIPQFLDNLKDSLSLTLLHFYPLAGRFATRVDPDLHQCLVYIDSNKGPGAKFIHATLNATISDILSPTDVPILVQSLFDHHKAVNHDGHTQPLLSVQVTELLDGLFVGVSINHVVVDGSSYWHFWNTWSEIHRFGNGNPGFISNPPVLQRWIPDGHGPTLYLPFTHPDEFICGYEAPLLRERIFHFSSDSMARLKAKANEETNSENNKISSFQALSALLWRCIVRANQLPADQVTSCRLACNNRHRLDPPLNQYYFGNSISPMKTSIIVGELLQHNLGWAALMLHESVANHSDRKIREFVEGWLESPSVYNLGKLFDSNSVMMGSSPRFDMYGNEFGLGKAVAVRSGYANKFVGKVSSYPGFEGRGSVDLEICLPPDSMRALESDQEFLAALSFPA